MITVRLKIGDGSIQDTYKTYRLIYMGVKEHIFGAEINDLETISYAEEDGEKPDVRTTYKSFEYVVQFLVEAENSKLDNANRRIAAFNKLLYEEVKEESEEDTDIEVDEEDTTTQETNLKKLKMVEFYNDDDKVKIVGYPSLLAKATDFWRDRSGNRHDAVQVEWTIKVYNPNLCDFEI